MEEREEHTIGRLIAWVTTKILRPVITQKLER